MMRPLSFIALLAAAAVLAAPAGAAPPAAAPAPPAAPSTAAPASKLPMVNGRQALATVNGDPVTLDEFVEQLGLMHQGVQEPTVKVRHQEPYDLLDRLINIKLILQEARNIGLNEDPGFKKAMSAYRREAMVMVLLGKRSNAITAPDPAAVQKIYEDRAREAKVTSYLIGKEDDAKALESQLKAGGNLDALLKPLVDSGKARPGEQSEWLKVGDMLPQVKSAVTGAKPGDVSPRIPVSGGFAFIRLDAVRVSDDPDVRRQAEAEALDQKRQNDLHDYTESLMKRNTKVDQKLLDRVDYETPKGFEPYLSDTRTVARIEGDAPVTVKDLSEAIQKKYYHGAEKAIAQKKVNVRKNDVLTELLHKRVLYREAKRQRIEQTPEFKTTVKEYEDGVLFGAFVERAIDPDIKLGDPELQAYLTAHISEYTSPEMMRLEGLAFTKRASAEDALAKLRKGSDFAWTRANAPGQVPPDKAADLLQFDPRPIITTSLPADLRKALTGAKAGDYRLYGDADGPTYVLLVHEIVPQAAQRLDEVRDKVSKKVFEEKREEGVQEWAKKLRTAYPVKTYVTKQSLSEILGLKPVAKGA